MFTVIIVTEKKFNLNELKWVHEPKRAVVNENQLILETEPHTSLNMLGGSAEAVELEMIPNGNFHFSIRCDFRYKKPLDQCGIVLYDGNGRKLICGCEKRDGEVSKIVVRVNHLDGTDRSEREIGSTIQWLYYRVWVRGGIVRVQYSFNGKRYSDLREFVVNQDVIKIGVYACSPNDSYFDCIFSEAVLDEDGK